MPVVNVRVLVPVRHEPDELRHVPDLLDDARAVVVLDFWLGTQLNICVDADLQIHQLVGMSLTAVLQLVWILISVALQLTPGINSLFRVKYNGHAVSNNDVLLSTVSIILIYMVHTVYRKHQHGKSQPEESSTV